MPEVAVLLVGGLGTRLRSAVSDRPKPLAEIAGRPFLEYLLRQVRASGLRDVVLCVGHGAELVQRAFGDGRDLELRIRYSIEGELMGTAGALKQAEPLLGGSRCVVMNGDSFFDIALADLFAFHGSHSGVASMALAPAPSGSRFGRVAVDTDGRVESFQEKRGDEGGRYASDTGADLLVNAGIYVFEREVFDLMPAGTRLSLELDVFPRLIGHGLYARRFERFFIDIGVPSTYAELRARPLPLTSAVS
jgi:NDP-sugar pyrophosphorylase family protein